MTTLQIKFLGVDFQYGPTYENIAEFSSFGPTTDGRIKPELVAPGKYNQLSAPKPFFNVYFCSVSPGDCES